jgi:hypothetical protein
MKVYNDFILNSIPPYLKGDIKELGKILLLARLDQARSRGGSDPAGKNSMDAEFRQ